LEADDATDVNVGTFRPMCHSCRQLSNNESFMTTDVISITCYSLCYVT